MASGAPVSGAWMERSLPLGGFQCFWTLGTNAGGAVHSLDLESTTRQPDPKPGPKKSPCPKCLRDNTD